MTYNSFSSRRRRNPEIEVDNTRNWRTTVHTASGWSNESQNAEPDDEMDFVELEEQNHEIDVEGLEEEIDVEEVEEEMVEQIQTNQATIVPDGLTIDGKPFVLKRQPKKQAFSETHVKLTTYLEVNLNQIIRMMQENEQIESITHFVNQAIKEHLMNHYNGN